MPSESEVAAVRATATSVLARAKQDSDYLEALKNDPVRVLNEAGLAEDISGEVASELKLVDVDVDVEGYRYCRFTDDGQGCWITFCTFYVFTD